MDTNTIIDVLSIREYLYTTFRMAFIEPLNEKTTPLFLDEKTREGLSAFIDQEQFSEAWSQLAELESLSAELKDELYHEFMKAFIGPNILLAPPWESVYLSGNRSLFQESTLAVRREYSSFGLVFTDKGKEPDDHIALELEFMVYLCRLAREGYESTDFKGAARAIDAQQGFLDRHLLQWVDLFREALEKQESTKWYGLIARLLSLYLHADASCLMEISELEPETLNP